MNAKQEIKEKALKQIIRPYHKNSRVTIMRVEDAIDLTIEETAKEIFEKIDKLEISQFTQFEDIADNIKLLKKQFLEEDKK